MARRWNRGEKGKFLREAQKSGTLSDHEVNIYASGGRYRQAAKTRELANRLQRGPDGYNVNGFVYQGGSYTLRAGEDFFSLAQRLYGNSAYFSVLQAYNRGLIPKAGMSIKIPEILGTDGTFTDNTADVANTMPAGETNGPGGPSGYYPNRPLNIPPRGLQTGLGPPQGGGYALGYGQSTHGPGGPSGYSPGRPFNIPPRGLQQGLQAPQPTGGASLPTYTNALERLVGQISVSIPTSSIPTNAGLAEGRNTLTNTSIETPKVTTARPAGGGSSTPTDRTFPQIDALYESTGRLLTQYSRDVADGLGLTDTLRASGYVYSQGMWKLTDIARQYLSDAGLDFTTGGSVPRPDLVYRRRTSAELSRELSGRGIDESNYTRYAPEEGDSFDGHSGNAGLINWRTSFG